MMNSNLTVIAYTKTKKKVKRTDWNDKSWRCLFYINKNILLAGKEYPFQHEEMKKAILDKLALMVGLIYSKMKITWSILLAKTITAE